MAARRYSTGSCACSLAYLARKARPTKRMPMPALTIVLPPNSQRRIGSRRSRGGAARTPLPALFATPAGVALRVLGAAAAFNGATAGALVGADAEARGAMADAPVDATAAAIGAMSFASTA